MNEANADQDVIPEQIRPTLQTGFRRHIPEKEHLGLLAQQWWAKLHPVFQHAHLAAGLNAALARKLAGEVRGHHPAQLGSLPRRWSG
ncbi:hypothetical protein [Deinococcus hopiensis]|uniref:hypothetical protein n=1 Tax=Deinococcus hopiensis TaxID=309885 RepID=UPI00111C8A3F|nr:hypothetical protein [Deinococcus hopiensis]